MKKRILGLLLTLCLMIGMLPSTVFAESQSEASLTTSSGATYYGTLNSLIDKASDGDTITLLQNVTFGGDLKVEDTITLDLNGKTLTMRYSGQGIIVDQDKTLTIKDAVGNGKISGAEFGVSNYAGTLIVDGGTICGDYCAISTFYGNTTINGGTIIADQNAALWNYNSSLTVTGGSIKGGNKTIVADSSTVSISGGWFSHEGNDDWLADGYAWTENTDSVTKNDYPYAVGIIAITFNENYGDTPKTTTQTIAKNVETPLYANTFTRTGYNFKGWAESPNGDVVYTDGGNVTFSDDITLFAVWELKPPVASVYTQSTGLTTEYTSLVDAMEQASDGDTITLIADYTEYNQINAPEGKTLTLDLNGHTVTSNMEQTLMNIKGTLTIDDSTQGNSGKFYGPKSASHSFSIAIPENGKLYVKGGTIETTGHTVIHTTFGDSQRIEISDNAAIKGANNILGCWSCGSSCTHISVTGGIFNHDVSQFVAVGYVLSDNTDEETKATYPYMVAHAHKWDTLWTTNGTNHWHECSCSAKADNATHTPKTVNAKEATTSEKGYTGDTVCEVCGYEIAKGEDIPVKATSTEPDNNNTNNDEPTYPQTGDSSNMFLWIALLFVSGLGLTGATVLGKKRKVNR